MASKELVRDSDAVIAAEKLYQNYKELVIAGFTPGEALIYLSNLIGYVTVNRKRDSKK
jgi:hypothetical protein